MHPGNGKRAAEPGFAGTKILVVEDEAVVGLELAQALSEFGCAVVGPAPFVTDALGLLRRTRPDAALLDVHLGDGRVTPAAEALAGAGVPFALVTGYDEIALDEPVLRDAPRLAKPFGLYELEAILLRLLDRDPAPSRRNPYIY